MVDDRDNPDSQDKKDDPFDIDDAGEVAGYISLDQARVLAMQAATSEPGAYGDEFRDMLMAFTVEAEEDTEDHYVITLSFRPQGRYSGTSGQEQFFIEKEGAVAHRQVLDVPRRSRRYALRAALIIGVIAVIGVVGTLGFVTIGGGSSGDEKSNVPAMTPPSVLAAVTVPTPSSLPTPMPQPTHTPILKETGTVTPTITLPSTRSTEEPATSTTKSQEQFPAELAFQDIFENATRVDRFSIDDIENCRVVSQFEIKLGDIVSVEMAFARKLDSPYINWDFYFHRWLDTSNDGVAGNEVSEGSIRGNPIPTGNYTSDLAESDSTVVSLYRTRFSGWTAWPEEGDVPVGDWLPKYNASLTPGTYTVRGEDTDRPDGCRRMLEIVDEANMIPDSVLIAWYVN